MVHKPLRLCSMIIPISYFIIIIHATCDVISCLSVNNFLTPHSRANVYPCNNKQKLQSHSGKVSSKIIYDTSGKKRV